MRLEPRCVVAFLRHSTEPQWIGVVAFCLLIPALLGLRVLRKHRAERALLSLFPAGMPVIDLAGSMRWDHASWIGIELLGAVIFSGFALAGLRRARTGIPDWYALGCLIADVVLGIYALSRARARETTRRLPPRWGL